MSDQEADKEQRLLPDDGGDAEGSAERDGGVQDMSGVGIGDEQITSGHKGPDEGELPDEGIEGT